MREVIISLFCSLFFMVLFFIPFSFAATETEQNESAHKKPEQVYTTLSNGMRVLLQKDSRFALVSLRMYVHVGSVDEEAKEAGMSHLVEHMVFKGTERRKVGELAAEVESAGGYINAATSFDYTYYTIDMPAATWLTGLDVLRDMVFYPSIDAEELASEKEVVLSELKMGEDSPSSKLFQLSMERGLRGTPYAVPIIGYESTIRGISKSDIHHFMDNYYRPDNMLLVVCGDINLDEALLLIEKEYGKISKGDRLLDKGIVASEEDAVALSAKASFSGQSVRGTFTQAEPNVEPLIIASPWDKTYVSIVLPSFDLNDSRSVQLDVLAEILGGGPSSRFFKKYQYELGLVDSISVGNYSFENQGVIYIYAVLDQKNLEEFTKRIGEDLAQVLKEEISDKELERAKFSLKQSLFRSMTNISGYTDKLGFFYFFGNDDFTEENYISVLNASTVNQLQEVASDVFRRENVSITVLRPATEEEKEIKNDSAHLKQDNAAMEKLTEQDKILAQKIKENFYPSLAEGKAKLEPSSFYFWHQLSALKDTQEQGINFSAPIQEAEKIMLPNNVELVLLEDATLPFVSVSFLYEGGNLLLDTNSSGLGNFTGNLLSRGTQKRSYTEINDFLAERAAVISAHNKVETFSLELYTPSQFFSDVMGLAVEMIEQPLFAEEEAVKERQLIEARMKIRANNPRSLAVTELFALVFPKQVYGLSTLGLEQNVASFDAKAAKNFWDIQKNKPLSIAIAGKFDKQAAIELAKSITRVDKKDIKVPAATFGAEKEKDLYFPEREQAHLFLSFPTVGSDDPDQAALLLLDYILSGQSGILFDELREKQGLGYVVSSNIWSVREAGLLIFYIGTEKAKLEQSQEAFLRVIKRLRTEKLDEKDLERAKISWLAAYHRARQSLSYRSNEAAEAILYGKALDAKIKRIEQAQKLSAADVQRIAQKYLLIDKAYTLRVYPSEGPVSEVE